MITTDETYQSLREATRQPKDKEESGIYPKPDWITFMILADYLDDHGEYEEAEFWRHMYENKKRPWKCGDVSFHWYPDVYVFGIDPESDLPAGLVHKMQGGKFVKQSDDSTKDAHAFKTEDVAMDAAFEAWKKWRLEQ